MQHSPNWFVEIEIPRIDVGIESFQAPHSEAEFGKVCSVLSLELSERRRRKRAGSGLAEDVKVNGWLKACCYQVILSCYAHGDPDVIFERIDAEGRYPKGIPDLDIFRIGLVAIFADDKKILRERDRDRLAKAMWHGFRHYIPSGLLEGFNWQYPAHLETGDRWRTRIEPSMMTWVVERRAESLEAECCLDEYRGGYSDEIENRVKGMRETTDKARNEEWGEA